MMNDETGTESPPVVETVGAENVGGKNGDKTIIDGSLVRKVGRLVARHTEETLSVVRSWMSEKA